MTKVDIGAGDLLHIVCGAPNVAAGQTVLVATIGCTLYTIKGDKIEIKKGKIRGEVSEGMICASDELGLGEDHSGIMVLEDHYSAGTPASDIYKVYTDTIFEVDLTPNRSDATSHMGVAKDLAAYYAIHHPDQEDGSRGLTSPWMLHRIHGLPPLCWKMKKPAPDTPASRLPM